MPQHSFLDIEDFRATAMAGNTPDGGVFKFSNADPAIVRGANSRIRDFCFSRQINDHANDVVFVRGVDHTSVFDLNPVALFGHASSEPPIGKASNVRVVGDRLMGNIEFASAEIYPFAETVFQLIKGSFLKAVSIGFLPKDWKFTSDKNRPNGLDFIKTLLLEISVVPIPANPQALISARAAGVDTRPLRSWAERILDGEGVTSLPRRDIETLRRQAAEPRRRAAEPQGAVTQLNEVMDGLTSSISDSRSHLAALSSIVQSPDQQPKSNPDGAVEQHAHIKRAMDHLGHAIARKSAAIGSLARAMGSTEEDDPEAAPPDAAQQDSFTPPRRPRKRANTPAERMAEIAEMRRISARQEEIRELALSAAKVLAR